LGVLREDGHGARRSLVCWRCLTTWDFLRVTCAGCEEQQFDALPVFTADAFPQVRVEACECCHRYLKTIDLTKDGLAVPIVDDVASISLDLWAQQQGYRRLQNGLLT
jgi:FdhE protein